MISPSIKSLDSLETSSKHSSSKSHSQDDTLANVSVSVSPRKGDSPLILKEQTYSIIVIQRVSLIFFVNVH